MLKDLIHRIRRKLMKTRLCPIRVYCMHHVSAKFDAESMNEGDWMQINKFKNRILAMRHNGVEFISLTEAYHHICKDLFRRKKYAVMTFDDGYASLKEILPWLEEQNIPAVLFINGKYLDGKSYRKNPKEKYLTKEELFAMTSPLIEIGSHGWEHIRATEQTDEEFMKSIEMNVQLLSQHLRYIPFHAYTYGDFNVSSNFILQEYSLTPVLIDSLNNYKALHVIHRELLK